ncbi:hypothetical protein D7B24_008352 [Verticillium nonalfalfae]|uniref:Rhodopsin domain-containing protein n=1 Tax=Verticillium nonalfalfae TaxID=1051616 RepID=A0A3M9Y578_9PEZI|nr:uncharacterized protein D7B24_008352 [Verticillium nonalfalfae]RNJ55643.1 hypothetical protein D7B24_008352 [Verticillium nonalfalfae]
MKTPPLDIIASWPVPNYVNPETRGPAAAIVAITLLIVVTFLVAIRVYTRKVITKGFGWDDILILFAYVATAAFTAIGLVASAHYGWGTHVWDVRPRLFPGSLKLALSSFVMFDLATSFTKLSMLALIYRLACQTSKTVRFIVIVSMVLISASGLSFLLVSLLQCRPLYHYWRLSLEPVNCTVDEATHLLAGGIINTSTNLLVVILPLAIVRRLRQEGKLCPRQVTIVSILFAAGFVACAASAARVYFTHLMTSSRDRDLSWHAWLTWLMSSIELLVGIMAASVPATKPFFARYLPQLISTASASRARSVGKASIKSHREEKDRPKRDSLSTIHELEEEVVFNRPVRTPDFSEPQHLAFYDVNKPLPHIKESVYSIPIDFDFENTESTRARPSYERTSSRGSDTATRNLTEERSFV